MTELRVGDNSHVDADVFTTWSGEGHEPQVVARVRVATVGEVRGLLAKADAVDQRPAISTEQADVVSAGVEPEEEPGVEPVEATEAGEPSAVAPDEETAEPDVEPVEVVQAEELSPTAPDEETAEPE